MQDLSDKLVKKFARRLLGGLEPLSVSIGGEGAAYDDCDLRGQELLNPQITKQRCARPITLNEPQQLAQSPVWVVAEDGEEDVTFRLGE
ncbi:hypothetical protein PPSIR1_38009 [Plesiocystis pacifica SIR-1]|uniref:Uncharacterized protein n=1 Tax=Plesiocystis pacifica SIR-1 TaxID=391625 RepID=A6G9P1_9BACT|nr:hypothetical protein [Plesiocystis pacifica]EDM77435.1 hypothetical protein PPSIR1_38009 [Plesiocystis pacifica SIR-1]